MEAYQKEFIEFALAQDVLRLGEFTLKSGRVSPYFFNAGQFNTGKALAALGHYYAQAIHASGVQFDNLFGPAYKGIPLAASASIALASEFDQDKPYSFNRKEAKDHGEGGNIVGAPLQGKILIVDDVITAGTAFRESMTLIEQAGATLAGVVIAMDRQEKGQGKDTSAVQDIEAQFGVPVVGVITFANLVEYLQNEGGHDTTIAAMENYRREYGIG